MRYLINIGFMILFLFLNAATHACTIFYYSDINIILAGNNEDWHEPFTKIWYAPSEEGKFGVVYFGWDGQPQGGMNIKGLFYDFTATPFLKVTKSEGKPFYEGNLIHKMMQECATITEAIELLNGFNLKFLERCQLLIGDADGNSAIIEGDSIIYKKGNYQICTNFSQSQYNEEAYPCDRYKKVNEMLKSNKVDLDIFRNALNATHSEGEYKTQYSNIYDLKNKIVYLYYFYDYDNVVKIDLDVELQKGKRTIEMHELFPANTIGDNYRKTVLGMMEKYKENKNIISLNADVYDSYIGKYKVSFDGMPVIINVTKDEDKLYYSTSEFGKAELLPESKTKFFFVYIDGIWDVEFKDNKMITSSNDYSFDALKIQNKN
ncbi:MAG: hypothetical protein V1720_06885 [bacterium]